MTIVGDSRWRRSGDHMGRVPVEIASFPTSIEDIDPYFTTSAS